MRLKKPFVIVDNKNPDEIKEIPTSKGIIRCYETDSFEVTNVCHHCGRFLSRDSEKKPDFLLQKHSVELWGIVKGIKWHTSHCKTHAHHLPYAPLKILIFPGFIITMVGIGLLFRVISTATQLSIWNRGANAIASLPRPEALAFIASLRLSIGAITLVPIFIFIIGLCIFIVGLNQYRIFLRRSMSRPLAAIPLQGDFYDVLVWEEVDLQMSLSSTGGSHVKSVKGKGEISLAVYLTGQQIFDKRKAYQKKSRKYKFPVYEFPANGEFDLGWLAVKSSPYTNLHQNQQAVALKTDIIPLADPKIGNWYLTPINVYEIFPEAIFSKGGMPETMKRALLWIRPTVKHLSAGHTLELEFDIIDNSNYLKDWRYQQLDEEDTSHKFWKGIQEATLQYVQIKVDENAFDSVDPPIRKSSGRVSKNRERVEWQNIDMADVLKNNSQDKQGDNPLAVTFSQPLTELKSPLEISFGIFAKNSSISGIDANHSYFWLPNGRSGKSIKQKFRSRYKTYLSGTLTVDPNLFAYQRETTTSQTIIRGNGIPLTSQVITELVKQMEEDHQIHIKSVDKSVPVTESEGYLAYQKRNWNILGRFYTQKNHPIDVYILLISRIPMVDGKTTVWGNITFRSLQMNKGEDISEEMAGRCKSLHKYLTNALRWKEFPSDMHQRHIRILG